MPDGFLTGLGVMLGVALRELFHRRHGNGHANGGTLSASTPATGSGPTVIVADETQGQIAKLNRDMGRLEEKVDRVTLEMGDHRVTLERCVAIVERNTGELTGQRTLLDRLVTDVREAPEKFLRRLEAEGLFTVKRGGVSPE